MPAKTVELREAVGQRLAHDVTEIRPGEFKGPAFKKGHLICDDDLCRLQRIGKNRIAVVDRLAEGEIHEDEAAAILARALAGEGVTWEDKPSEGKITLHAALDGLLEVDTASLAGFNMVQEVMAATLHTNTLVKMGDQVAATRALPMIMDRVPIQRAAAIAAQNGGVVSVRPLKRARAGLVITGDEVFHGLIQDRFEPILRKKLSRLGTRVIEAALVPDDPEEISRIIRSQLDQGCELILLSGGMSVDPDDVTRLGIKLAGAEELLYGAAVLPGAMFLAAYIKGVPLLGVPACGLFHRTTVLDLILPRVLAGRRITRADLSLLGHGGLCRNCESCVFPECGFGKG